MNAPATPRVDLTARLSLLAADIRLRVAELAHIDPEGVLFCLSRSRAEGLHGTYARIVPLRFAGGEATVTRRRGRYRETFRLPSLIHEGRERLYLIQILVPRFLRLSFEQKLQTLVHELYHISENFDGDIRRFPGRTYAHGASRKRFDRTVAALTENYLKARPDPDLLDLLNLSEEQWRQGRVRLTGLSVPLPRARLVAREKV
jgi:hypothetical protein